MKQLHVSNAPHIHSGDSTQKIMLDVVIAMLPATIAAVVIFGAKALWIIVACVAVLGGVSALVAGILKKKNKI